MRFLLVLFFLLLVVGCSGPHVFVMGDTEMRLLKKDKINAERYAIVIEYRLTKEGKRVVENALLDCTTWEMGVTKRFTWREDALVDLQRFTDKNFFKIQGGTFGSLIFGEVCVAK